MNLQWDYNLILLNRLTFLNLLCNNVYLHLATNDNHENDVVINDKMLLAVTGTFGFCLMVILAAVSLPSVASSLSWKEFSFLQRYLGWWAFIFSVLHIVFVGWDTLIEDHFECIFIPHQLQVRQL